MSGGNVVAIADFQCGACGKPADVEFRTTLRAISPAAVSAVPVRRSFTTRLCIPCLEVHEACDLSELATKEERG